MESNSFLEGLANLIALSVFLGAIWLVRVIFTVLGAGEAYLPCLAGVIFLGPIVAWIYYTVRQRRAARQAPQPDQELWFIEFPPEPVSPVPPEHPLLESSTQDAPAVPGPPDVEFEDDPPACPVCFGRLEEDVIYCRRCGTPHHRECFRYAGACSIYACGSRQYRFKAPGNREYTLTIPRVERELVTTGPPSGLPGVPSPGGAPQAELRG